MSRFFRVLVLLSALIMASCRHEYRVGVSDDEPTTNLAQVTLFQTYDHPSMDGTDLDTSMGLLDAGTHTFAIAPGSHTFRFKFSDRTPMWSVWATGYANVSGDFEAGHRYMIMCRFSEGKVRFTVEAAAGRLPMYCDGRRH